MASSAQRELSFSPERLSLSEIAQASSCVVWTLPPFEAEVRARFGDRVYLAPQDPPSAAQLCVIGGGGLIDQAKTLHHNSDKWRKLIAVPVIYGSGAEVSPVAVTHTQTGDKAIEVAPELIPDALAYWPELLDRFSESRLLQASGDVWSHALEGFWSPLADDALRAHGAQLLRDLLDAPELRNDAWFELSARACSLQSQSSVGLIHGIAHVLESKMRSSSAHLPGIPGHAALCATFLLPVLKLHLEQSDKVRGFFTEHRLDADALLAKARERFDPELFASLRPSLVEHWSSVMRDACSRTNPMLIRKRSLAFFENFGAIG